jgi:dihydrofolate reductase
MVTARGKRMRLVVSEFVSLDGVIEDPGGAEQSEYGGWTVAYWSDEIAKFKADELLACDGLLLGRVTYQGFAAAWPSMTEDEGFARMNSLRKYVVSATLDTVEWNNSKLLRRNPVEEVKNLKRQSGNYLLVTGSAMLAQELARNNLIDEYRLAVYPVVVGNGKRLFGPGLFTGLNLAGQQATSNGVLLLTYTIAGS